MQLWDVDNFRKKGVSNGKISTKEISHQNVWGANTYSSSLFMLNAYCYFTKQMIYYVCYNKCRINGYMRKFRRKTNGGKLFGKIRK